MSNGLFKASDVRLFGLVVLIVIAVLVGGNLYKKWDDWNPFGPSKDKIIDEQKKEIDKLIDEKKTEEEKKEIDGKAEEARKEISEESDRREKEIEGNTQDRKDSFDKKIAELTSSAVVSVQPKQISKKKVEKPVMVSSAAQSRSERISAIVIDTLWEDYCEGKANCGEQK